MSIGHDAVTIRADGASIRSVLEELSQHSDLMVMSQETLDEPVTVEVNQVSLPEAIRRLLRHKSYILHQVSQISGRESSGSKSISRLWVFSNDAGGSQNAWTAPPTRRSHPVGSSETIDYQILALSRQHADREEVMFGLAEIGDGSSIAYLQQGLSDPQERVREAAIRSLAAIGGTESVHALSIALNDPIAGLRIDAVDALGEIGGQEAMKLLQTAMTDENHTVREAAAEWLTELAWARD